MHGKVQQSRSVHAQNINQHAMSTVGPSTPRTDWLTRRQEKGTHTMKCTLCTQATSWLSIDHHIVQQKQDSRLMIRQSINCYSGGWLALAGKSNQRRHSVSGVVSTAGYPELTMTIAATNIRPLQVYLPSVSSTATHTTVHALISYVHYSCL